MLLSSFPLLLAAVDWVDVIKGLAPLFFILYWVLSNFVGAKKGQQAPGQRRPVRPPPAKPVNAPVVGGSLQDEFQEIRRRAEALANQRPGQPPPAARPVKDETPRRRRRPLSERPSTAANVAQAAPEPRKVGHLAEALAQRAEERLATAETRLTSIERGDAERERHRHQTFDHRLGQLSDAQAQEGGAPEAPQPTSPAGAIAALMRSAGGVQQAVILGEILNRPEVRWERP
jgi:hypothetical protein